MSYVNGLRWTDWSNATDGSRQKSVYRLREYKMICSTSASGQCIKGHWRPTAASLGLEQDTTSGFVWLGPDRKPLHEAQKQEVALSATWREVSHEQVPEEMSNFNVLVLPTHCSGVKEQFGHVLIEATAMVYLWSNSWRNSQRNW